MPDLSTGTVRIEPDMLPGLIGAYQQAEEAVASLVADLKHRGRMEECWTEDPVAKETMAVFNTFAVEGDHSALAAIRRYERELSNVLEALTQMHAEYHRTNDTTATMMRSL